MSQQTYEPDFLPLNCANFQPLKDWVLVMRLPAEEVSQGGIIIPNTAKEQNLTVQVIACGPGKLTPGGERMTLDIEPGDVIVIEKWRGEPIDYKGMSALMVDEDDICGVFTP